MRTNARSKESNQQATVPGFGNVWFHKDAIANIFGFGDLVNKYRITYDSEKEDAFLVHMEHKTVKFTRTPEGLYQFTVPQSYKEELKMKQEEKSNNMIQTVDENKIVHTKRQMERQKLQENCIILLDHLHWKHSKPCSRATLSRIVLLLQLMWI